MVLSSIRDFLKLKNKKDQFKKPSTKTKLDQT